PLQYASCPPWPAVAPVALPAAAPSLPLARKRPKPAPVPLGFTRLGGQANVRRRVRGAVAQGHSGVRRMLGCGLGTSGLGRTFGRRHLSIKAASHQRTAEDTHPAAALTLWRSRAPSPKSDAATTSTATSAMSDDAYPARSATSPSSGGPIKAAM